MDNHHHIPSKWRKDTNDLANAVGFHATLGVAAAEADALRDAYVWFDQKTGAKHTLSFLVAHGNATELAVFIRAAGVASGVLDHLQSESPLICGLVLKRTAALPLSQLAAFKAGATFVPCDPEWPSERTVSILAEANAPVVIADVGNADGIAAQLMAGSCRVVVLVDERCAIVNVLMSHTLEPKLLSLRDEARALMSARTAPKAGKAAAAAVTGWGRCSSWFSPSSSASTQEEAPVGCWPPPEVMYIMYTSGSTGKPKGCCVPTAGVWHRFRWGTTRLGSQAGLKTALASLAPPLWPGRPCSPQRAAHRQSNASGGAALTWPCVQPPQASRRVTCSY